MTLQEFIKKYNGKFVEAGGTPEASNQCVDLANQYIFEVLGKDKILGANATDFWTRADSSYQRINPDSFPKENDIVIWNYRPYGHIAIATGKVIDNQFEVFSQNFPLGSPSVLVNFNLSNLIGYLRFNDYLTTMTKQEFDQILSGYVKKDVRLNFNSKNGSVWICNNNKRYKIGTKPDDIAVLASILAGEHISEAELKNPITTDRREVL